MDVLYLIMLYVDGNFDKKFQASILYRSWENPQNKIGPNMQPWGTLYVRRLFRQMKTFEKPVFKDVLNVCETSREKQSCSLLTKVSFVTSAKFCQNPPSIIFLGLKVGPK